MGPQSVKFEFVFDIWNEYQIFLGGICSDTVYSWTDASLVNVLVIYHQLCSRIALTLFCSAKENAVQWPLTV